MRIRFLSEQIYESAPGVGPTFPEGLILDETEVQAALGLAEPPSPEWITGFLNRWVQRQVAVEVDPLDHDANGRKGGAVTVTKAPKPAVVNQPLGTAKRGEPTPGSEAAKPKAKK